jgi:UDP-glucose 4-epimerase
MKDLVLVTGGTGFIGSHTAVALIEKGYDVVIIDDLSNSQLSVLDGIEKITGVRPAFEQFNLCDQEKVNSFFEKYKNLKAIIHFAAFKAVGDSVNRPLSYYRNNLVSLMNLLEGMSKYNVQNIVFSSSCTVYGQPDKLPVTEQAPIKKAMSPYGNTKQICEEILQETIAASKDSKLKSIALRYFNPIGAHPSALIGELPLGTPENLVPFITQTAIGLREELKVFGNDYNTPDGSCIRDYIDIMDLAQAHVVALNRIINNKNKAPFEVFNIGTGKGLSVLEIINAFIKTTGVKLNYKIVGRRPGDIEQIWADTTFANKELGWKSETPIEHTLLAAWKWERHIRNK